MPRKVALIALLLAIASVAATGVALAGHDGPPTWSQSTAPAVPIALTVTSETDAGQTYHDGSGAGIAGTQCTDANANTSTGDDGASDNIQECYDSRDDLKTKDAGAGEGIVAGTIMCNRTGAVNQAGVVFDGVWTSQAGPTCSSVPPLGGTTGRAYTGAYIPQLGEVGAAAGGNATTQSGCVQLFLEGDGAIGNVVADFVSAALHQSTTPPNNDNDTDLAICGDAF